VKRLPKEATEPRQHFAVLSAAVWAARHQAIDSPRLPNAWTSPLRRDAAFSMTDGASSASLCWKTSPSPTRS
jgi:hypothetical protein